MASIRCPRCASETIRPLDRVSPDTAVKYRRCESCGHVWVVFKDGSTHNVTPLGDENGS